MGVTVLIPFLNEAGSIGDLLLQIPLTIGSNRLRLILIDDGSTDDSYAEIQRLIEGPAELPDVRVIQLPTNGGKGAALRIGMSEAAMRPFDALVWMDSDGQHLPSSLAELITPVLDGLTDMCVGSRYLTPGQADRAPLNRRLVRLLSIRCVEAVTGFRVTDPFSGYRCFSPAAARALEIEGDRYEAELESCFSIAQSGLHYSEVPIPRIYGPATSKMAYQVGAFRGRLRVLSGYVRTVYGAWQQGPTNVKVPAHG